MPGFDVRPPPEPDQSHPGLASGIQRHFAMIDLVAA
jgi:hypothetical protein